MKERNKEPMFNSGEQIENEQEGYFALGAQQGLQSVTFATTDNPYLSEYSQEDSKEEE